MSKVKITFLIYLLSIYSNAFAYSQYDGWWFNKEQAGSGVSIEIQGETMFVAIYTYDLGIPIWMTSKAKFYTQENTYKGRLLLWNNGAVSFLPVQPRPHDIGVFSIKFTSSNNAIMSYGHEQHPMNVPLSRFMPIIAPGQSDTRIKGWWYDPEYDGWGIFLEANGGTLFGAHYFYMPFLKDKKVLPSWLSFSGPFSKEAKQFSSTSLLWFSGSALGVTPYQSPESQLSEQNIQLKLNSDGTIDMTTGNIKLHLLKFHFN